MGLHGVCRNKYHHFDRDRTLQMFYNPDRKCHILSGVCLECGTWRIVYTDELRDPDVIKYKLGGAYEKPNKS